MTSFAVDTELLLDLVERMSTCQARFEELDDEVDARMKRLHAAWQGSAADLHAEAHRRWVSGSRQMTEALTTLRNIARTADANYNAAVSANRRMWAP